MTFDPQVLYGGNRMERLLGIRPDAGQGSYFTGESLRAGGGMGYLGMTSTVNDNFGRANQAAKAVVIPFQTSLNDRFTKIRDGATALRNLLNQLNGLASQGAPSAPYEAQLANQALTQVETAYLQVGNYVNNFNAQVKDVETRDANNQINVGSDWVWLQNNIMPGVKSATDGLLSTAEGTLSSAGPRASGAVETAKMEVAQAARDRATAAQAPAPTASVPSTPSAPTGVVVPPPTATPQTDYMKEFMEMMRMQMTTPAYSPPAPPAPPPPAYSPPPIPTFAPVQFDYSPPPPPPVAPVQPQMSPAEILYWASQQAQQQPQSFDSGYEQIVYDIPADQFVTYDYRPSRGGFDTSLMEPARGGEMFGMGKTDVGSILSQIDAARAKIQGALAAVPALAPLVKKPEQAPAPAPAAPASGASNVLKYGAMAGAAWLAYRAFTKRGASRRRR